MAENRNPSRKGEASYRIDHDIREPTSEETW